MGFDAPWHWVILAGIVIALFGYKRLPDAARALGQSLRVLKTEVSGLTDDHAAAPAPAPASDRAPAGSPAESD